MLKEAGSGKREVEHPSARARPSTSLPALGLGTVTVAADTCDEEQIAAPLFGSVASRMAWTPR